MPVVTWRNVQPMKQYMSPAGTYCPLCAFEDSWVSPEDGDTAERLLPGVQKFRGGARPCRKHRGAA